MIALYFQTSTPQPPTPWWQIPEPNIPFIVIIILTVLAFIFGGLARPLVDSAGNAILLWVRSWGKHGDFRRRYLTGLIGNCRHLALLPANVVAARWKYQRRAVELEELYTSLSLGGTQSEDNPEEFTRITAYRRQKMRVQRFQRYKGSFWARLGLRIRPPFEPSAGELGEIIQSYPRLVIRGDPGSGKSTMLRYLALTCARSLRNDRRDSDKSNLSRLRLGWKARHFPILINLSLFSDVMKWPEGKRLLDAVVDFLPGELRSRYPKQFFEKQLEKGHCLVMLDGLDELGSPAARSRMASLINDLATTYNHRKNRFIVSTRIVGYEGQLDTFGFIVKTVEELDQESVEDLVLKRYQAIAVGESLSLSEQESLDLRKRYQKRAQDLLAELSNNPGLRTLTPNPLLLSLIVLVSLVKVKLPEQRHILYRDCVEVLADRWQDQRRVEAGSSHANQSREGDLNLDQKVALLREIALHLQLRRKEGERQVLLRREDMVSVMAAKLPDLITMHSTANPAQQAQEHRVRALAFLDNIREESGILVEKGLDEAGEPVIGFSHLTFQEYLAADALRSKTGDIHELLNNLFNATWREVLLLYVSMQNSDHILTAILGESSQTLFARYLLAGRCVAEGGPLDASLRRHILDALQSYLQPAGGIVFQSHHELFDIFGGTNLYDWLLENLDKLFSDNERWAVVKLTKEVESLTLYKTTQGALLRLLAQADEAYVRYASGCILSRVGDPRFDPDHWRLPAEPRLGFVEIPAGPFLMGSSKETDPEADDDELPQHSLELDTFYIARYPVTVAQFQVFVETSRYQPSDPDCLTGLPNHPVVWVSWHDALAYCRWLDAQLKSLASQKLGEALPEDSRAFWLGLAENRLHAGLPSEAEWEKAARGGDGRIYPWGNSFDADKANTSETGIGDTSAVGCFPAGASPYGVLDQSGNVWEWTRSLWGKDFRKPDYGYPYNPADGRENLSAPDESHRVLRGGTSFAGAPAALIATGTARTTGTSVSASGWWSPQRSPQGCLSLGSEVSGALGL